MRISLALLAAGAAVGGCTLGPDFERPNSFSPASWFGTARPVSMLAVDPSTPVPEPIEPRWWESFGDPVLARLVARVAESNLDLRAATARIEQSRAQLRVTGTDRYPQVNGNASYTRQQQSERGVISLFNSQSGGTPATQSNGLGGRQGGIPSGSVGGGIPAFDLWQYGFDASWELDLWGRIRRSIENARASLDASASARRDTLLSVRAEVARDYLQLRGAQESLRITRANQVSAQRSAQLTAERARAGLSSLLDLANAQAQVTSTGADIPQFEQQEAQLINAIGLLLGEYPGALLAELSPPRPVPPVPSRVPIGLPSELARRRPDIRQAEAQLWAATAGIGVARADFFPRVTLSGSFAFQALQLADLGYSNARTFGIGPSISIPIFEGGRLRGTLALRQAQQQEAAASYQRIVLGAFRDVDDALTAYAAEQVRRAQLTASVESYRRALDLASTRYRQGLSDFLEVLTAQRSLLGAEQALASSTATVGTNLIALYKALGGGWDLDTSTTEARR